jgi:hypothetical protein
MSPDRQGNEIRNKTTCTESLVTSMISLVQYHENVVLKLNADCRCVLCSLCTIFVILWDEKLLPAIRKHTSLMSSVFDSTLHCEMLYSLMKMSNQDLGCVLLMNTWKGACESQQQKLNLISKD